MFEAMATVQAPAQAATADLVGRWEGSLRVGEAALPIIIRVAEGADGRPVAAMDSPAQNARDIPVSGVAEASGVVRFVVPSINGRFEGAMSADGSTWTGAWSQGAASLPLVLTRTAATAQVAGPDRPQTPKPPFPYGAEEVTFPNTGANIALAGTLTVPQGAGPFPAVVLLTGSGAQDRDQTILDHRPFAVWADALTRRGVAVLRYDDRGMGGSGGGSTEETTADFATDAASAMTFLRSRPEIDPARIGLMGHSEGGATALIAVTEGAPAAFVVMIAGPAVSGAEILSEQAREIVLASGGTAEQADQTRRIQARLMAAVVENKDDGPAATAAVAAQLVELGQTPVQARQAATPMGWGWYRYFAAYDPGPALSGLPIPLLALYGGKDRNVPAEQNRAALARFKPDADIVVLPGLNHLMQHAETSLPAEYGAISETLAPEAISTVVDWVVRTVAR